MSFVIKDKDRIFVCCFARTSEDQFTLLVTNCQQFFSEILSAEVFKERRNEANPNYRYEEAHLVKVLTQGSPPESCTITDESLEESPTKAPSGVSMSSSTLHINLTFIVKTHQMKIFFNVQSCEMSQIGPYFMMGFMKLSIEHALLVDKMRRALEAKDLEIEEYKLNGATLVRESLATQKFDFEGARDSLAVKTKEDNFTIDPLPLLNTANIPTLCSMINAENVLQQPINKPQSVASKRNAPGKSRVASRRPKPKTDKDFQYENSSSEESEEDQMQQPVRAPENPKKSRMQSKATIHF